MRNRWATLVIVASIVSGWSSDGCSQPTGSVEEHVRVLVPLSEEPRPTVVWASGCSGFFHPRTPWHYVERSQTLLAAGYAIAYVDYVAALGLESACAGEATLLDIATVLIAAVESLEGRSGIDTESVVLLGSSLGGGGVLAALSQDIGATANINGVLSIYPACAGLSPWRSAIPVWIWYAGGDLIQPPSQCRPAIDGSQGQISERTFPGVHHGFDSRGLPQELEPGQPALAYDVEAAEALWQDIELVLLSLR
jgi:dienelactone hydrolase